MANFAPWNQDQARALIADHAALEGATLPVLHALQAKFGCVPLEAEPLVAAELNLSRAEVHGIVSFYHEFRRTPPGRHVLKLCRAEACQAVGAEAVAASLDLDWHATSADGTLTLEPAFCLGFCAVGPAALLDGDPLVRLNPSRIAQLLHDLA